MFYPVTAFFNYSFRNGKHMMSHTFKLELFETEDQLQTNIHRNVLKAHTENYISHKSKKRVFLVFQTPLSVALWLKRPAHTVPGQGPDSIHIMSMYKTCFSCYSCITKAHLRAEGRSSKFLSLTTWVSLHYNQDMVNMGNSKYTNSGIRNFY